MSVLEPFGFENDWVLYWNLKMIFGIAVIMYVGFHISRIFWNRKFPSLDSIINRIEHKLEESYNKLSLYSFENQEEVVTRKRDRVEFWISIVSSIYLSLVRCYATKWIFIYLIGFFFIWFSFIEIQVTNTINIYNWFQLFNPTDAFTLTLLDGTVNSLRVLLPVSLPFYYFAYREQKNISDSSLNDRSINIYFSLFLLLSLSALAYIANLLEVFSKTAGNDGLALTNQYAGDLGLVGIYILVALYFLLKCITKLFRNINIESLLKSKLRKTFFTYLFLTFWKNTRKEESAIKRSKTVYSYLSYQVETVYQLLIQASKKNLGKVYGENFKELKVLLQDMFIDYRLGSFDNTTKHLYLLHNHKKVHTDFYKTILKNHKHLITTLISNHKIEDAKDAINLLLELMPSPSDQTGTESYNKYLAHYYVTLYEVISYLYDNEVLSIHSILEELNNESGSNEAIEQEGILRNFQSLIIKATDNNDVKMLSSFSYYLSNFFQKSSKDKILTEAKLSFKEEGNFTITEHEHEEVEQSNKPKADSVNYHNGSIFIFLQALLKSIELTHYETTGFLIKFLVTTYDSKDLNQVFLEFYHDPYENKYLPKVSLYKDIDNDFHMNAKVKDYLLTKLVILLYSQQRYVMDHQVDFLKVPEETIDISVLESRNYLSYMFKKLDKAKSNYGLLFLEDDKFLKQRRNEFKINAAPERSESVLEDIISIYKKLIKNNK